MSGENSAEDQTTAHEQTASTTETSSTEHERAAGKRRADVAAEGDEAVAKKGRRLTMQERMQLKLLANVPSMNEPLRDARGRRRSTCVSSEEIVEAGLATLIATHATAVSNDDDESEEGGDDADGDDDSDADSNAAEH